MNIKTTVLGFTLVELLVVVGILSILSLTAVYGLMNASYQGKIAQTVVLVKKIESAARQHYADTGQWPAEYTIENAGNPDENPLIADINNLPGWAGPYLRYKPSEHAWGGAIRWFISNQPATIPADLNGNGNADEFRLMLDDDDPTDDGPVGGMHGENDGIIPTEALERIDAEIDDGDLTTGNARGNRPESCTSQACIQSYFHAAANELILIIE